MIKHNLFVELTTTIRQLAKYTSVARVAGFVNSSVDQILTQQNIVRAVPIHIRNRDLLCQHPRPVNDVDYAMGINNDLAVLFSAIGYLRSVRERNSVVVELTQKLNNQPVFVKNLQSDQFVQIRLADVGGPTDPSTDRYWSM